jgi:uncharacterized OB-fold protein
VSENTIQSYGDPINAPFWEAARAENLVVQHCLECENHQFYGRPFCLECQSERLEWKSVSGRGTVYSKTCVRVPWVEGFDPPYVVAVVELEEGPRLLTNIVNGEAEIGDPVRVVWRHRDDAPPVPLFEPESASG